MNKFNLGKFNIQGGKIEDPEIYISCYEKLDVTSTFEKNIPMQLSASERFGTIVVGTSSLPFSFSKEESIKTSAILESFSIINLDLVEHLTSKVQFVLNISIEDDLKEEFKMQSRMSEDTPINFIAGESFNSSINFFKTIMADGFFKEDLMTLSQTSILNNLLVQVNVNLKPGETLILDSDKFTAYLEGENVLDDFKGDWINLKRELVELKVSSDYEIEGTIIVNERYL